MDIEDMRGDALVIGLTCGVARTHSESDRALQANQTKMLQQIFNLPMAARELDARSTKSPERVPQTLTSDFCITAFP